MKASEGTGEIFVKFRRVEPDLPRYVQAIITYLNELEERVRRLEARDMLYSIAKPPEEKPLFNSIPPENPSPL